MLDRASRLLLSSINLDTQELGYFSKRRDWNYNKVVFSGIEHALNSRMSHIFAS